MPNLTPLTKRQQKRGDELMQIVASRISSIRIAKGLTQHALSKRAGLSRSSIVNIEAGRQDIPIKTLARIADGLGIPLGELVG